ncbi:unnamed protein product, partial [Lymnaea stagnalis]
MEGPTKKAVVFLLSALIVLVTCRITASGQLFVLQDEPRNYSSASTKCKLLGYDGLALVDSNISMNNALSLVKNLDKNNQYWIGMHYSDSRGRHVWDSGTAVTWALWNSGEPDNLQEDKCVRIRTTQNLGTWTCAEKFMALCGYYNYTTTQFNIVKGKMPRDNSVGALWSGQVRSVLECVMYCIKDPTCQYSGFDRLLSKCTTWSAGFSVKSSTDDSPSADLLIRDVEIFIGQESKCV